MSLRSRLLPFVTIALALYGIAATVLLLRTASDPGSKGKPGLVPQRAQAASQTGFATVPGSEQRRRPPPRNLSYVHIPMFRTRVLPPEDTPPVFENWDSVDWDVSDLCAALLRCLFTSFAWCTAGQ